MEVQRRAARKAWLVLRREFKSALRRNMTIRDPSQDGLGPAHVVIEMPKMIAPIDLRGLRFVLRLSNDRTLFRAAYSPADRLGPAEIAINYGHINLMPGASADMDSSIRQERQLERRIDPRKMGGKTRGKITRQFWRNFLVKNYEAVMASIETAFIHEFIHHMDVTAARRGHRSYRPSSRVKSPEDYYNLPLERNAYLQQALYFCEYVNPKAGSMALDAQFLQHVHKIHVPLIELAFSNSTAP